MSRKLNKRLTNEEIEILLKEMNNLYGFKNDTVEVYENLLNINISDIYYLSCVTEISCHRIFSYLMYEYVEESICLKRQGLI